MARINLCPNPSLKNNASDFFGGGARVTGVASMPRTTAYENANATSTLPRGTVVAGRTYRFSAYVKGSGGGSSGNVNINWYSGGGYLASAPGQGWTVTTGNVTRVESGAQVAPTGATQALLNISGADAQTQVTAILYEESSSLLEFFDGDSGNCVWNSTDGSSTSTNSVGDSGEQPPPSGGSGDSNSDEAAVSQGWGDPIWESDFNDPNQLHDGTWGLYDGTGHNGNGTRDPERISYTGGLLRLQGTAGGSTGGMSHFLGQQYGRWEGRMRAYSTGGTNGQEQYHPVLIVWPDSDEWPIHGEYDFIETDVGESAGAFIHYPHPSGQPVQQEHASDGDVSIGDWHNYAIDWQSTGITGYIDGREWYHFSGGAGPHGRSNIQNMPSGHLTVQLDNFGGSPHRPANMDVEWVRIYDNASVSSDRTIGPTGIAAPDANNLVFANLGAPLVGTRHRLYLNNASSAVSTTPAAGWEQTAGAVLGKVLGANRSGTNVAVTVAETSTSNTFDVLLGQWISAPFTSGGTLQGSYQICAAYNESSSAADLALHFAVRVVSGDGSTSRGIFSEVSGWESGTTLSAGQVVVPATPYTTPVVCQTGDRLVVEVGYRATNTVTTSYSLTMRYGGTSGDLESGAFDGTVTASSPWIEFSDPAVKALFYGQTASPTGVVSAGAVGTPVVVQPPTLALAGVGGLASTEAFGSVLVKAEARIVAPLGFTTEAFGTLSVGQNVVTTSITSGEAHGSHRVRRLSDIAIDAGIVSAEAFGAPTLVHFQALAPVGILSEEAFGSTQVEDPARRLFPFAIMSGEQFGIPTLRQRLRSKSILSGEQFGLPTVKLGRWKLVQPTRIERWRLGDPGNVIYVTNVVGLTVYGDDSGLFTIENPKTETLESATYVWQGGHDNITDNQAIRNLWLANGYQVEMSF